MHKQSTRHNDKKSLKDFGKIVSEARQKKELSQSELARRIDVTPNTINAIETKKSQPRLGIAVQIAKELGVSLDWMTGLSPFEHGIDGEVQNIIGLSEASYNQLKIVKNHSRSDEIPYDQRSEFGFYGFFPELSVYNESAQCAKMVDEMLPILPLNYMPLSDAGHTILKYHERKQSQIEEYLNSVSTQEYRDSIELDILNEILSNWTLIELLGKYARSIAMSEDSYWHYNPIDCDVVVLKRIEAYLISLRNKIRNAYNLDEYLFSDKDRTAIYRKYNEYLMSKDKAKKDVGKNVKKSESN